MSSPPVFGVLCSGRPVDINVAQTAPTRFVCEIPAPGTVAELGVFLLPGVTLPQGAGVVAYYSTPPYTSWTAFATLDAQKPSTIVRTSWASNAEVSSSSSVQIGLSLEPLADVANVAVAFEAKTVNEQMGLAQLIARDVFTFMGSFHQSIQGLGDRLVVPSNVMDRWISKFEAKLRALGPRFLYEQKGN